MKLLKLFRRRERILNPESKWIVVISNETILLTDPNGNKFECTIGEIEKVIIETTDQGPFYPDVWWKIISNEKMLVIPQGATGEKELLERIQNLPDFDNGKLIESMSSTANREFICWSKR